MSVYECYSIWINAILAVITLLAVVVALFGTKVMSYLFAIKLDIEDCNLVGEVGFYPEGGSAYFYHLKVVNKSKSHYIEKCSVALENIERFNSKSSLFEKIPTGVPRYFQFAPIELYKDGMSQDFNDEIFIDFGQIYSNTNFRPQLISNPPNVELGVATNETVRYHLKLTAKNFRSSRKYIYEVFWDGEYIYPENPSEMKKHLIIKRIPNNKR